MGDRVFPSEDDPDGLTPAEAKRVWTEILNEPDPWERMAILDRALWGRPQNGTSEVLIAMTAHLNAEELVYDG